MSTPPASESLISSLDHRKSFSVKEVSELTGIGMLMTKSILTVIASLLIANVAPAETPTLSLPDGDKRIDTLAQDVDNVASASILFKRCINEGRPDTETLKAANVLADSYRHLCLDVLDFYSWFKYWKEFSSKPSDFSV